jgi:prepilin-type processing-associated H-X9-DG protein
MLAERAGPVTNLGSVSWAANPLAVSTTGSSFAVSRHIFGHPPFTAQVPQTSSAYRVINVPSDKVPIGGDDFGLRYPSSRHRGQGACVAFCDGHTQFLSEKIDSWVYCQLLTPDSKRVSSRAAGWQTYDHDGAVGTANVSYLLDAKDVEK